MYKIDVLVSTVSIGLLNTIPLTDINVVLQTVLSIIIALVALIKILKNKKTHVSKFYKFKK